MKTFREFLKQKAVSEGLWLPDSAAVLGLSRINTLPTTNAGRKKLHPHPVKALPPVKPLALTVPKVVPPRSIPQIQIPFRTRSS